MRVDDAIGLFRGKTLNWSVVAHHGGSMASTYIIQGMYLLLNCTNYRKWYIVFGEESVFVARYPRHIWKVTSAQKL